MIILFYLFDKQIGLLSDAFLNANSILIKTCFCIFIVLKFFSDWCKFCVLGAGFRFFRQRVILVGNFVLFTYRLHIISIFSGRYIFFLLLKIELVNLIVDKVAFIKAPIILTAWKLSDLNVGLLMSDNNLFHVVLALRGDNLFLYPCSPWHVANLTETCYARLYTTSTYWTCSIPF
jgi:hypothetical protein